MPIQNYIKGPFKNKDHCHEGNGTVIQKSLFTDDELSTNLRFISTTILPPNTSIGIHDHTDNEEVYVILEGNGTMYIDGEFKSVTTGDVVLNPPFGTHGLENTSSEDLRILVFEVNR